MKKYLLFPLLLVFVNVLLGQTNLKVTNPIAEQVMLGNFNPADFMASVVINDPATLVNAIHDEISTDSLQVYITRLSEFRNRNSGSDTLSTTEGIGAARNWIETKFQQFSAANEGRLQTGFFQYDEEICGMSRHKNTIAVLPGMDATDHSIIIIEGHMDSRCAGLCDIDCDAEGVEDNASGTVLVMELARVMSQYSFNQTIVFMATTAEEQGLLGANAFAQWCENENIPVKAVFNNDVVGGIICGETSSEPSCPGFNHVDSTQVRLFSFGGFNSRNKGLSRFIKLEYQEELLPLVSVPMMLTIMSAEDRTGRGSDHIPFRERGYAAMRFCSANEHGNADVSDPDYHDRQHTSEDILGVDTDNDMVIDSFFVDFNYLARNATINGVAASMAAIGPKTPIEFIYQEGGDKEIYVEITDPEDYLHYRIGLRALSNDFDTIYTLVGSKIGTFQHDSPGTFLPLSIASVDTNGIESLFTGEQLPDALGVNDPTLEERMKAIELVQNKPNPFDEATTIGFYVNKKVSYQKAFIIIYDLSGMEIERIPTQIQKGMNEVLYTHGYNKVGTFVYSLVIDGNVIDSKKMIFSN
jgi:hypothetical protein